MEEQYINNTELQNREVIDLREVFKKIWKRKKLFIWVWIITAIVSAALILPVPRTYTTDLTLAPEMGGDMAGGGLASLASTFGINMSNMETNDAFYPELYPDVIATNTFIVDLFDVPVVSLDGEINTDYYTYLKDYQKETAYMVPVKWIKKQIFSIFKKEDNRPVAATEDGKKDPRMLSEEDNSIAEIIRSHISCSVDKKTMVISIAVEDQDAKICADIADSVRVRLQNFITDYRTNKARGDLEHYRQLRDSAYIEYQDAMAAYSNYSDSHQNTILQYYLSQRDELENAVQMKLQTYTAMSTQFEAAKAKVQERTPAFTILKAATVPFKPTYPKRVIFVGAMLIISTMIVVAWIFKQEIVAQLTHLK